MTDPVPVTLDDLKRAIEAVPAHPGPCGPGQNVDIWLALLHEHKNWALEAWRTAFEWLDQNGVEIFNYGRLSGEYEEVKRLIREHLR